MEEKNIFLERENLQLRKCLYDENSNTSNNNIVNNNNNNNSKLITTGLNNNNNNNHYSNMTSAGRYQGIKWVTLRNNQFII